MSNAFFRSAATATARTWHKNILSRTVESRPTRATLATSTVAKSFAPPPSSSLPLPVDITRLNQIRASSSILVSSPSPMSSVPATCHGMMVTRSPCSILHLQKQRLNTVGPLLRPTNTSPNYSSSPLFSSIRNHQNQIRCLSSQLPDSNNKPNHNRSTWGLLGTGASAAVVLFGKTKYIFAALKLTKLASLGSMLVTVGAYSMFFGWPYALGMVGLILVHECGHALVMLKRGIPFSPMVFVPFIGAAVQMNRRPRDAWEDAMVAFGGPVLGSLGAAAVGVVGHSTESQLLIALADFGLMINLFNLLPLGSMDGGRIAGALSPWMNVAGLGGGVALAYTGAIQNPVFYLILLAGGYETFMKFYDPAAYLSPNYYKITPAQRAAIGLGYVGLIGGLALAMDTNERYKKSPEQLIREQGSEKTWDMR